METISADNSNIKNEDLLNDVNNLSDEDFTIISEACIVYVNDKDKFERLNTLNKSLIQLENSKEISKFLLKSISIAALKLNIEANKISKYFQINVGLNEAKSNILKNLWEKHSESLKETNNNQSLMISQLVDLEWKFGVTASTNTINKLGNTFLQLKLVYSRGGSLESKHMELTLPQFYSFLHEMNKAKSQMDYLS